jgi:hypothetical protein
MIVSGNQNENDMRCAVDQMRALIPLANADALLKYHDTSSLVSFCRQQAELFSKSNFLLFIPMPLNDAEVDFVGTMKRVFRMDDRKYIFIDENDKNRVNQLPVEKRQKLLDVFHDCFIPIHRGDNKKRSRELVEYNKSDKKRRLRDELNEKTIQLALKEQELQQKEELHQKELEILRLQLENKDLKIMSLEHGNAVSVPLLQNNSHYEQFVTTIGSWLNTNRYKQEYQNMVRNNNVNKFDDVFNNFQINDNMLYNSIKLTKTYDSRIRIAITLTYSYKLKRILKLISEQMYSKNDIIAVINQCPESYRIVLYATGDEEYFNHDMDRLNYSTIATHCHFIMISKAAAAEKWKVCLDNKLDAHTIPSMDLIAKYYPDARYFGPNTFMSYTMCLCVESNTITGTGNNKNCPFCENRVLALKQLEDCQISHQLKNCSTLAMCSNNEVDILLTLMTACKSKEKKRLVTQKFLFGTKKGCDDTMKLSENTLLRHANLSELKSGHHINGLRINSGLLAKTRRTLWEQMRSQLEKHVFCEFNHNVINIMSSIYNAQYMTPPDKVSSLIYDSDGKPFMDSKFDGSKKLKSTVFEDELYFSFEPTDSNTKILQHMLFVNEEKLKQSVFIQNSSNPYNFMQMDSFMPHLSNGQFLPNLQYPIQLPIHLTNINYNGTIQDYSGC